jgi:hypothetical protein
MIWELICETLISDRVREWERERERGGDTRRYILEEIYQGCQNRTGRSNRSDPEPIMYLVRPENRLSDEPAKKRSDRSEIGKNRWTGWFRRFSGSVFLVQNNAIIYLFYLYINKNIYLIKNGQTRSDCLNLEPVSSPVHWPVRFWQPCILLFIWELICFWSIF